MLGVSLRSMEKRPIQEEGRGRVEVRLVALYYKYRDKLPPDRPLGSCVVITFYIKIGKGKAENVFSLHPELLSLYIEDDAVAVDKTFKSHSATLHVVKTCCQNVWVWREGIREGLESNPGGEYDRVTEARVLRCVSFTYLSVLLQ